ncbi:hypothetical protein ACFO5R_20710 [Halosolutus amylolyticus]|uniref:DUF7345 domain-containing protein n=1 Tax=Halosolutus amylolyticus TaxID=2932267 RepID=A0ABD5PVM6_9EURY|nr:hypothetical protein [Halosolutus amylolyticus]
MERRIVALGVVLVLSGLLAAPASGAGVAASDPADADEPMLHVELTADGDATVSLVSVYDLSDEDERDAFASLESDDETRAELLDRFADRTGSVAANASEEVDREMTVTADSIDVRTTDDERGVVVLSVTWERLAAVEDDRLVVTEPFASGYEPDRTVVVSGPDGSTVETTTPTPDAETDGQASWNAGTSLDGFEATFSLSGEESAAEDPADDSLPGFGVPVTAAALLAVLGIAIGRRHDG